jgi:hypothetical protein
MCDGRNLSLVQDRQSEIFGQLHTEATMLPDETCRAPSPFARLIEVVVPKPTILALRIRRWGWVPGWR